MTTPNRLQSHWNQMKPLILERWPSLTEADLKDVDCEFDRLVTLIKERYDEPILTVKEAHIREEVLQMLKTIEG